MAFPRWATPPTEGRLNRLDEFRVIARRLGFELMPWQERVVRVGSEYDPKTGQPFYREVICTVPRQSGKSAVILVWESVRAVAWGKPQRIVYTAQTGWDARRKLIDDHAPLLEKGLGSAVKRVLRGSGNESVIFADKIGSRIDVQASSAEAGHGRTLDLAVIDEAFSDTDDRREQAVLPAMATRADAQLLVFSTAGDQSSVYLRRKVDAGRASVEADKREGIAYFEWSASDEDDPDDRSVWWLCMPALGHTITEAVVAHARETMSDGEFRRAYLNQWVSHQDRLIPANLWADASSDKAIVEGRRVFAASASMDRDRAAIAVSDYQGNVTLVEHRPNVGWLEDRCVELAKKWNAAVAVDVGDPAGHLADRLTDRGVEVKRYTAQTYAHACGSFFDRLADRKIHVFPNEALDVAVAGATRRSLGDAWAWARKSSDVDISPLVAVTLAVDAAGSTEPPAPRLVNLSEV